MLWDFAGVDGLQVAIALWGEAVAKLSPWRSLFLEKESQSYSILRLCEGNFRIRCEDHDLQLGELLLHACANQRVWFKQLSYLESAVYPTQNYLAKLQQVATPTPPFRLDDLPLETALPARINQQGAVIWRHQWSGEDIIELHSGLMLEKSKRQS